MGAGGLVGVKWTSGLPQTIQAITGGDYNMNTYQIYIYTQNKEKSPG